MSSKIRIAARLRPQIAGEINDGAVAVQRDDSGSFINVMHPRDHSQRFKFPFSSCYGEDSTQDEIYENDVKPLLDVVYSGVTVTVFAYGVTSSGKTHTIQGTKIQPGIIPRVVKDLFERCAAVSGAEVSLSVSYMEIYKEDVYDLLVERDTAPKLPVRENESGQVFVANLSTMPLSSVAGFDRTYAAATKRRTTGSTNLNRASSRSHAILTIYVHMIDTVAGQTITGKINLVDLAGSENNKLTGNDPSRMAESSAINRSLSVLGQVVHALNQGASRIPYRNSKLTRILQDALGGTAVGLLICNLAPGAKFRQDTWNTLNFATRTKEIENKPVVNVRETQPLPKSHFAALAPQPVRLPSANVPVSSGQSGRPSLLPTAGPSKLPGPTKGRMSSFGLGFGSSFQPFALGLPGQGMRRDSAESGNGSQRSIGSKLGSMTEEEIDERISKAVELEVARRLEERERKREAEEAERQRQLQAEMQQRSLESTPELILPEVSTSTSLPSGVLTPLLKRHQDLDDELKRRLVELEQKYEQTNKEAQLADVLSPVSKKKTGRAYVALARAHSEKGNLQVALDLYRKARSYVPDNVKLKERIFEIEYAVKNDVDFLPEPKKKRSKGKKGKKVDINSTAEFSSAAESSALGRDDHDGDSDDTTDYYHTSESLGNAHKPKGDRSRPAPFDEATNNPQKQKRAPTESEFDELVTPPKKVRKEGETKVVRGDSDDELVSAIV
ncbi:kinesin-domain-containing protein [Phellopilus nigrolimitatus]|nr:kinesin-domain-containing protein [Phellopilus nigrolimitatus]KAH8107314.1 kinesin-domain-containing protein [Phellopilus nigrolimitatus]